MENQNIVPDTDLTPRQRYSLALVFRREWATKPVSYRDFRWTVRYGSGCIMVPFANMWLGIEPDGYTHS